MIKWRKQGKGICEMGSVIKEATEIRIAQRQQEFERKNW